MPAGSIVALEGLGDEALETQLRLLPTSSQILVLPPIQTYMEHDSDSDSDGDDGQGHLHWASVSAVRSSVSARPYDARRYIRRVHAAATARQAAALDFLRDSTRDSVHSASSQPKLRLSPKAKRLSRSRLSMNLSASAAQQQERIVFLNGGTATNHALCIEAIRKHDVAAGGSLETATRIFEQLIAGGLAGMDDAPRIQVRKPSPVSEERVMAKSSASDQKPPGDDTDPITKAMRAADALDRQTEALQPSTHILDLTNDGAGMGMTVRDSMRRRRPRSLSLPISGDVLELLAESHRMSLASKAASVAGSLVSSAPRTSGNFNFVSPSLTASLRSPSLANSSSPTHSDLAHGSVRMSYPRSPARSSVSTIFPASMRLDAIAAQSQRSSTAGISANGSNAGARGRSRYRPRNLAFDATDAEADAVPRRPSQDVDGLSFPMPPQRARSLERGEGRGTSAFGTSFLLNSSRDTSSISHQRLSAMSDASFGTSYMGLEAAASSTDASPSADVPDVPEMPERILPVSRMSMGSSASHSPRSSSQLPPLSKPHLRLKTSRQSFPKRPMYVDRGTDVQSIGGTLYSPVSRSDNDAFEAILPTTEDLVVCFDEGNEGNEGSYATPALDAAIRRCKELFGVRAVSLNALHGVQSEAGLDLGTVVPVLPETPKSVAHTRSSSESGTVLKTASATPSSMDDYDPFAPHEYNPIKRLPSQAPSLSSSSAKTAKPPTPAHTPPPQNHDEIVNGSVYGGNDTEINTRKRPHFHTIATAKYETVLALHNELRSVLAGHFAKRDRPISTSTTGTAPDLVASTSHVLLSSLSGLPGMETTAEIWTPLLDGVDLILAVGGQHGVQSELMSKITSKLSAAMVSPDGQARCGHLDIRYLVANAMQALAMQQAHQSASKSKSRSGVLSVESKALATLVLKQLDLFLRTHPTTLFSSTPVAPELVMPSSAARPEAKATPDAPSSERTVLVDYPLELLAVVLSLRHLVGRDLVEVASVVLEGDEATGKGSLPGFQTLHRSSSRRGSDSSNSSDSSHSSGKSGKSGKSAVSPPTSRSASPATSTYTLDPERPPFMRSNYLLTSAATDADVDAFVAAACKLPLPPSGDARSDIVGGRYSALSTATTAAGILSPAFGRSTNARSSPLVVSAPADASRASTPDKPDKPESPKKAVPGNEHAKSSSVSTIRRVPVPSAQNSPEKAVSPTSPAPSSATQASMHSRASLASKVSQASSHMSSVASQPASWRTGPESTHKPAASTGLAPAPVVVPGNRLVAKTIQVSRRKDEAAATPAVPEETAPVPSVAPVPEAVEPPQKAPTPPPAAPVYNDSDYDFDDDDDDFENDLEMRRLMPLFMRDRSALLIAKESVGARMLRPQPSRSKSSRLVGIDSLPERTTSYIGPPSSGPRRPAVDYHNHVHPSHSTLRESESMVSMHSQMSRSTVGPKNDGKKALKWLGLA